MTDAVAALRRDLAAAGFTVAALLDLWGAEAADALTRAQRVPAERRIDAAPLSALTTLASLFVLGRAVPRQELDAALPDAGSLGLAELKLVELDGTLVLPRADLRPYAFKDEHGAGEWWIASDLGELALGHALPPEHVLGVGGASLTLAGITMRRPVGRALDLGTGCGIQALHASRFAERVVATDVSTRALRYARLNAELNGIDSIEFRQGDLLEPVRGERFELVVSNPPFVITPRVAGVPEYEYRDGGRSGDGVLEELVAGLEDVLAPGGIAQLLGNWEYRPERAGLERVSDWLAPTGLDGWVVERDRQSPEQYAETWIRDGGTRPGESFDALYEAWLDDFDARSVTEVGFGYLLLRRPREQRMPWRRFESLYGPRDSAPLGAHLAACLDARDRAAALDDEAFAAVRFRVAGDVTEERHHWPGDDDPTVILLRQGGGFGRARSVDTALAAVLGACDGELSLAAICEALAELVHVDPVALRQDIVPRTRELLVEGFVTF